MVKGDTSLAFVSPVAYLFMEGGFGISGHRALACQHSYFRVPVPVRCGGGNSPQGNTDIDLSCTLVGILILL